MCNQVRVLLGDRYTAQTPTQTIMKKPDGGIPNDLPRLRGIRLVTASETGDGHRLDEAQVKAITGGDRILARVSHDQRHPLVLDVFPLAGLQDVQRLAALIQQQSA